MNLTDPEALALERFVTARLGEAEAAANAAGGDEWRAHNGDVVSAALAKGDYGTHGYRVAAASFACEGEWEPLREGHAAYIALNNPAAALRSIAADRRLLAELARCEGDPGWDSALMLAVRCRATAWSTHPACLERWKP